MHWTYLNKKNTFILQVLRREVHRTYDKIYATIYGQCVGDALGLLTEGLTKDETKKVGHPIKLVIAKDKHVLV